MGLSYNFLKLVTAFSVAIFFSTTAFSANSIIDDMEGGKSQNKFEAYWYVYDDSKPSPYFGGEYEKNATTGEYIFKDTLGAGSSVWTSVPPLGYGEYGNVVMSTDDNHTENGQYCFKADFTMGDVKPFYGTGATESYDNWVGFGTGLISEGNTIDFSKADTISFWAKATVDMDVWFQLATDQRYYALFATFFQHKFSITTEWAYYSVAIKEGDGITDGFVQPAWALDEKPALPDNSTYDSAAIGPLDPAKSTKIQWLISVEDNPTLDKASASILIDDIVIQNFVWIPEDACMKCTTSADDVNNIPDVNYWISSGTEEINFADGAWYCYNDAKDRKTGDVVSQLDSLYATLSSVDTTEFLMNLLPNTGYVGATDDNDSNVTAAVIKYTLGELFKIKNEDTSATAEDSVEVKGFVGIGLEMFDTTNAPDSGIDLNSPPSELGSNPIQTIFFNYKTSADTKDEYIIFSVMNAQDLVAGASFHVKLPATNGEWMGAFVPLKELVTPPWDIIDTGKVFDPTAVQALQWSIEGVVGNMGMLYVDNVYFIDTAYTDINVVKFGTSIVDFSMKLHNKTLSFTLPNNMMDVKAELVNLRGITISSDRISGRITSQHSLSTANLASGFYILQLKDLNSNAIISRLFSVTR